MTNGEINEQINKSYSFQGRVSAMANSIELVINQILQNNDVKPKLMFSEKIKQFEKLYPSNNELVIKLKEINRVWNITKHGIISLGINEVSFFKDGKIWTFNKEKQDEISKSFTSTIRSLSKFTL